MVGLVSTRAPFTTIHSRSTFKLGISRCNSLNSLRYGLECLSSSLNWSLKKDAISLAPRASVESVDYVAEPATKVKFPKEMTVPGCLKSLVLLGAGYREKVFAIIGVKVYAAGFFVNSSIKEHLSSSKGKIEKEISVDSSIFNSIFNAPCEKSLNIKLVRNVDGKTFWDALNDVITPRIKEITGTDEVALSVFRTTFMDRTLKEGTNILLTWVEPSMLLISVSADRLPSNVDAKIESSNVNSALFDGFFGDSPVSPSLKSSVVSGLEAILN
ncbi:Chalcone-flavonone isomerase family protein [Rhynchospora pubera]|uniref:Chalcone-flavonone isomerase family protein n=1 Tax=Rhynchospora pubera TaxID=906938 RepID=A0AAV8FAP8_9POAL|nr:Chalcone-flavonone isomerase family protein [Rhynchospora pubera]